MNDYMKLIAMEYEVYTITRRSALIWNSLTIYRSWRRTYIPTPLIHMYGYILVLWMFTIHFSYVHSRSVYKSGTTLRPLFVRFMLPTIKYYYYYIITILFRVWRYMSFEKQWETDITLNVFFFLGSWKQMKLPT